MAQTAHARFGGTTLAAYREEQMRDPEYAKVHNIVEHEAAARRRLAEILKGAGVTYEELARHAYSNKGYLRRILEEPFYRTAKSLTFLKYALIADALGYEAEIVFHKKGS